MGRIFLFVFSLLALAAFRIEGEPFRGTNAESLSFWNDANDMRDLGLVLQNDLAAKQRSLELKKSVLKMRQDLMLTKSISRDDYLIAFWEHEEMQIMVEQAKSRIEEAETREQVSIVQYQMAIGDKPDGLATLVELNSKQWQVRTESQRLALKSADAEFRLRSVQHDMRLKLASGGNVSQEELLTAKEAMDQTLLKRQLAIQRAALAEGAYKESELARSHVRSKASVHLTPVVKN